MYCEAAPDPRCGLAVSAQGCASVPRPALRRPAQMRPILTVVARHVGWGPTKDRRLSACPLQADRRFRSMRATSAGSYVTGISAWYAVSPVPAPGLLLSVAALPGISSRKEAQWQDPKRQQPSPS